MAESTIIKTKRDGVITIADNAGVNTYQVAFEAGDLSISIPGRTISLFLDRGVITNPPSIRFGDDQPMTGSFTANLRDLTDAAADTLVDLLTGPSGNVASWVSTMGANGEVFTVDITWAIEGTDHGDAADHTIKLLNCYLTGTVADGDPATVSIDFTSYDLYPTVT